VRVLVTGAGGMLGREVVRQLGGRGHEAVACDRRALDITDAALARDVVRRAEPDAIVHCAAFTNVDAAESSPDDAFRVNVDGTENVARAAAESGARFMYVSTDYVFDGEASEPYRPDAPVNPLSVYGRSKLGGEEAARLAGDALIARTSWVYGRGGSNFASRLLERARAGERVRAIVDQRSVPTWVHDTADVMIRLLEQQAAAGVYHVNNGGSASWYEFACAAVACAGLTVEVESVNVDDLALPAPRPAFSAMDVSATERAIGLIRDWSDALVAAVDGGL
jgi:dTDP-4-dehydrorhamnose reductase